MRATLEISENELKDIIKANLIAKGMKPTSVSFINYQGDQRDPSYTNASVSIEV